MAIDQALINRINELAKIKKERELSEEEKVEQGVLRGKYLQAIKENFKSTLNNIDIVDEIIVKGKEIKEVEKELKNIEAIKTIKEVEKKIHITYLCKEITEEEILKKIKKL